MSVRRKVATFFAGLTLYTLAKSQRIAGFLDALTNERLPLRTKVEALLNIWRKKRWPRLMSAPGGTNGRASSRLRLPSDPQRTSQFALLIWTLTIAGKDDLSQHDCNGEPKHHEAGLSSAKNRAKPTYHRSKYRSRVSSHFRPFPKPQHTSRSLPVASGPSLQAESPDLACRGGAERLDVQGCDF